MALSKERSCAEALMMACDERLGAQSPAALMVCDTYLARDFWTSFVHQSFPPPAASQMWAWGFNFGQLGLGDTKDHTTPTEVTALHGRRIHAVTCGLDFTMAVVDNGKWPLLRVDPITHSHCSSGEIFAWGNNRFGQLGLGDTTKKRSEPVATLSGRRVAAIACGAGHSVAVLENGELFAWGSNRDCQLGVGDNANRKEPTQVTALAGMRVVAVACGMYHTAAVLESGELFTWGWNEHGQLGHGDLTESKNTPQLVEALRGCPVIAVACGFEYTLALLKTGEVFAWGKNREGQLGLGKFSRDPISTPQQVHFFDDKRIMSIHCCVDFSGAVLESGELFLWGRNDFGQLGTDDKENRAMPTLITKLAGKRVLSIALGSIHAIAHIQ